MPSHSLSRQHTYIPLSLVSCWNMPAFTSHTISWHPSPRSAWDGIVRGWRCSVSWGEEVWFAEIIQSLHVTCLLIFLAPDPRCFLYEGRGHHHLLLHGYHLQAGRIFRQPIFFAKKTAFTCLSNIMASLTSSSSILSMSGELGWENIYKRTANMIVRKSPRAQ